MKTKKSSPESEPPVFPVIQPQEEARPYSWEELTDGQRDAATQAIGLLLGMLEAQYQSTAEHELLVPMRQDHHNNVIFLDGRRGSGKTSLMATLLQALQRKRLDGPDSPSLPWSDCLIPVAFLDLHPLPEMSHLLLHLVGKLEQQVELLEDPAPSWTNEDAPPWKAAGKSELPSRQRWRELFQAVVTWESNLEKQAAHLDFDFYAWELKRQESRRREVGHLFRSFVDALCSDTAASPQQKRWLKERQPFFVIAVDDADLVPHRSVEILDLLRKLWHPRLAFLIAGDIVLFRVLLRNHLHGVFRRPLAHIHLPKEQEEGLGDDERLAIRLADNVLEKIIPPLHRCRIADLSREKKLEELKAPLEKLTIEPDLITDPPNARKPKNLGDYFEQETYVAAALPNDLRSLHAEKRRLEGLINRTDLSAKRYQIIAQFTRHLWERLLNVEPLLSEEKEVLDTVVTLDEKGMLVVQGSPLVCRYGARHTRKLALGGRRGWSLALGRDHRLIVSRQRSRSSFPDSIKGALKLATDLAADVKEYYFLQESPTPSGFNMDPVVVRWEELEEYRPFRGFSWSLPDWHDFLSFTLFRKSWNDIEIDTLLPLRAGEANLEKLAYTFLDIALTIAESRKRRSQPLASELKKDLSKRVVDLATKSGSSKRREVNSHWAYGRAGLLAAPEAGLPSAVANQWLGEIKAAFPAEEWERARRQLYDERRQQVLERWDGAAPSSEIVEKILKTVDTKTFGFDWSQEIDEPVRQEKDNRGP